MIRNISEKDRAKDVEQFDDILRTFINEMNKFESKFGSIRDEEKMLAVKKFMPESLLNYRSRGTIMSYSEIIIALENMIVDKVSRVPLSKKTEERHECSNGDWDGSKRRRRKCEPRKRSENCGSRVAGCPQRNKQWKMEIRQKSKLE